MKRFLSQTLQVYSIAVTFNASPAVESMTGRSPIYATFQRKAS